ncbi:hypothetical protein [Anaerosporobacter mobilis]|nr:hypothetical protein [Anaerosporobacter mobilis]
MLVTNENNESFITITVVIVIIIVIISNVKFTKEYFREEGSV